MVPRDNDMVATGAHLERESSTRRWLASLRLVEPLMQAALYRPGLGKGVTQKDIISAHTQLLFRSIDLTNRIWDRFNDEPSLGLSAYDRYMVAREVVSLIALHWRAGSQLTANDLSVLAEHAASSGLELLQDLKESPYRAGNDAQERLSSATAASARIMLALRDRVTLGHEVVPLCQKITQHMGRLVNEQASRLKSTNHTPTIKALIRVAADFYPTLWDAEIKAAHDKFKALKADPEAFREEAERLSRWPLDNYFRHVENAMQLCLEMATSMQQLLDEQPQPEASPSR